MRIDTLLHDYESESDAMPYVAMIAADGSVTVQHSVRDDFCFPDESALDQWQQEHDTTVFKVEIVNNQNHYAN